MRLGPASSSPGLCHMDPKPPLQGCTACSNSSTAPGHDVELALLAVHGTFCHTLHAACGSTGFMWP